MVSVPIWSSLIMWQVLNTKWLSNCHSRFPAIVCAFLPNLPLARSRFLPLPPSLFLCFSRLVIFVRTIHVKEATISWKAHTDWLHFYPIALRQKININTSGWRSAAPKSDNRFSHLMYAKRLHIYTNAVFMSDKRFSHVMAHLRPFATWNGLAKRESNVQVNLMPWQTENYH